MPRLSFIYCLMFTQLGWRRREKKNSNAKYSTTFYQNRLSIFHAICWCWKLILFLLIFPQTEQISHIFFYTSEVWRIYSNSYCYHSSEIWKIKCERILFLRACEFSIMENRPISLSEASQIRQRTSFTSDLHSTETRRYKNGRILN